MHLHKYQEMENISMGPISTATSANKQSTTQGLLLCAHQRMALLLIALHLINTHPPEPLPPPTEERLI